MIMLKKAAALVLIWLMLLAGGCGYRFVDPVHTGDLRLAGVKNSSSEPTLEHLLEEALRTAGIRQSNSGAGIHLVITEFTDRVSSISSSGSPIRQRVSMTVFWRIGEKRGDDNLFGQESASLSYPYSTDPVTLDWNRGAAIRRLCQKLADQLKSKAGKVR